MDLRPLRRGPIPWLAYVRSKIVLNEMDGDAEDPGLELRASLELAEPTIHRDEHFLHDVFGVRCGHAHATHDVPNVIDRPLVDLVEVSHAQAHARVVRRGGVSGCGR